MSSMTTTSGGRCPFDGECDNECALFCPSEHDETIGTCAIFEIRNELASLTALLESIYKNVAPVVPKHNE